MDGSMNKEQYWKSRARDYSSFKWAKDPKYIDLFLNFLEFRKTDLVLDAGVGTGLISEALAPRVKAIIGVDTSLAMLSQCSRNGNTILMREDLRSLPFMTESFDKVIARNVFHHIFEDVEKAAKECYRTLKEGGAIIVGERVPPAKEVRDEYARILELKDRRFIFTERGIWKLLSAAGFKIIKSRDCWIRDLSVKSWLSKSNLPEDVQDKIFDLHVKGSKALKKAHNMKIERDDCFIDIKSVIVGGVKT